jgi:hypothetical protein
MTLRVQTFQKNFGQVVSEDLLDYTERVFFDKLIGARVQHATQLHFIVSGTEHLTGDSKWNNVLLALGLDF